MAASSREEEPDHIASEVEGLTMKQLVTDVKIVDPDNKIKILTIGRENSSATKTILLIGQTGSGKSTLLNAMINYLMGVQFEDNFRYSVKDEIGDQQKKVTDSQTEFVTGYHFYHKPGMVHDYNYLIIDTPGLLDSRGKKMQDRIRKQTEFFLREGKLNITELHSLAFVINGTTNRSMKDVKDIITQFENLFGRDTIQITNVLATHCDSAHTVQQVLEDVGIKYTKLYNFQNDCIFSKGMQGNPMLAQIAPIKWQYVMKKYQELFEDLDVTTPGSLVLSREAAIEKKELEGAVNQVKHNIEYKISTMIENESQTHLYEKYKKCMEDNKEFKGEETVMVKDEIRIEGRFTHAHNCKDCNRTCIFPCYTAGIIVGCLAFYGACEVCNCKLWSKHERQGKRIESKLEVRSVTHKDMKYRYQEAMAKANDIEEVKKKLKEQEKEASTEVEKMTQKIIEHITRINRIIRNPNPKSPSEYFNDVLKDMKETISPKLTSSADQAFLTKVVEDIRIQ